MRLDPHKILATGVVETGTVMHHRILRTEVPTGRGGPQDGTKQAPRKVTWADVVRNVPTALQNVLNKQTVKDCFGIIISKQSR